MIRPFRIFILPFLLKSKEIDYVNKASAFPMKWFMTIFKTVFEEVFWVWARKEFKQPHFISYWKTNRL